MTYILCACRVSSLSSKGFRSYCLNVFNMCSMHFNAISLEQAWSKLVDKIYVQFSVLGDFVKV